MRTALVVMVVCATAGLAAATKQPIDVPARAKAAGKIVVGRITDVESGRFDINQWGDRIIVTRAWVEVDEVLKGRFEPLVAVDIEGGSIGDLRLEVSDMPAMARGDRAVLFLDAPRGVAHTPNGRGLGILKLEKSGRVVDSDLTLADVKAQVNAALR